MKIIIALLIFSIIILFHELGHFLLAKANGIRVNEFSLGLGPTLFGIQKGETKYSIKLLPFGGACMVEGEDSEFARSLRQRSRSAWRDDNSFEVDLQRCASHIESENDRVVFHQWLAGRSHEQIAAELGISPELARKRWQLIRERLKARLLSEGRL